jgi:hypothetical protein
MAEKWRVFDGQSERRMSLKSGGVFAEWMAGSCGNFDGMSDCCAFKSLLGFLKPTRQT